MATRQVLSELAGACGSSPRGRARVGRRRRGCEARARRRSLRRGGAGGRRDRPADRRGPDRAGSRVDLVRSGVAIAVRAGASRPDIGSEDAVRRAVLAAGSLGYSTGPSGTHLARLFERWGIADAVKSTVVQAPPGRAGRDAGGRREGRSSGSSSSPSSCTSTGIDVLGPLPAGDPDRHHVLGRRRRDVDATRGRARDARLHGIAGGRRGEAAKRDGAGVTSRTGELGGDRRLRTGDLFMPIRHIC